MSGECGFENPRPNRWPARTSLSTFSEALFGFGSELKAPSDFATSSDYRMRGRAKADRTNERVSEAVRCSRRMSDMACTVGEGQRYPHSAMQSPSLPCCARSGTACKQGSRPQISTFCRWGDDAVDSTTTTERREHTPVLRAYCCRPSRPSSHTSGWRMTSLPWTR
jgi:hypothetical protein